MYGHSRTGMDTGHQITPVESQKAQIKKYFWGNIIRPTNGSLVGVQAVGDAPHVGGRRGAQVLWVEEGGEGRPHTALQHIGASMQYCVHT